MKFTTGTIVAVLATIATCQSANPWVAPNASDRRGPCPMVNTLANHGFLPHNGLNISLADLLVAFTDSVNLAPAATKLVGEKALLTSSTASKTTFNLDDLNKHGIIEHDGSLSRADVNSGDNHSFNPAIWNATSATFTDKNISISVARNAREARLVAAKASNPAFNMGAADHLFSAIETALYLTVFRDPQAKTTARTEWVHSLFRNERLPYEQGWKRSDSELTSVALLALAGEVAL